MSQPYGSHYDDIERDSHSVQHHDSKHQPYKSVPTSDDHPITDRVDTKIPNVDSSTVEDGLAESAFDTGSTKTYLYICLCYCGGLFVAIANYLLFDYLHERRPADTIPQGWIQVISVAFVNLSRSLLGASLGIAYIQLLWYKFRRRWTTAKLIDRLLALPWNPLNLLSPITLWTAKLEWIFALFCITLPLLSTVPPGSLKVKEIQSKPFEISVPTINFIARSNNSYKATRDAALYFDRAGPNSVWGVKPTTQRLALDSLTRGEPIMWTNPLPGRNASYNVQFEGPRLECHWNHLNYTIQGKYKGLGIAGDLKDIIDHLHPTTVSSKNTEANMDSQANHSNLNDLNFFQYVGMNEAVPGHGITRDYPLFFAFSLWFRNQSRWVEQEEGSAIDWTTTEVIAETPNDKRRKQSDMSRITCTLGLTNYSVHVEHILGSSPSRLTYRYEDLHFDYPKLFIPLDGIYEKGFEFIDERTREFTKEIADDERTTLEDGGEKYPGRIPRTFGEYFLEAQSHSILYAMLQVLGGTIYQFGRKDHTTYLDNTSNGIETNILSTKFAKVDSNDPYNLILDITPQLVEEAFINITLSVGSMDRELWKTNATVTSINDMVLVYDFNPVFLLVPYGIAFGISLILIVIGLYALRNNGVPAAGTSFLQIVSTTSAPGCDSLRTAAAECSLGGEKNFSEKLLELPLKFGEIVSNGSGDIGRGGSDGDSGGAGDGKTGVAYNTTIAGSGWGGTKLLGFGTFGEVITMKRKGQ